MIDIKVPTIGESISEVTLIKWLRNEGDWVERDEVIAELESEKATFEINAEKAGKLKRLAQEGLRLQSHAERQGHRRRTCRKRKGPFSQRRHR